MFFGIIGYVFFETFKGKKTWKRNQYVLSLIGLVIAIAIIGIDFHWCRVVSYYGRFLLRKERKELRIKELEEADIAKKAEE